MIFAARLTLTFFGTPIDPRVSDSVGLVVQPAQERLGVAPGTRSDTKRDVTSLELIKRPVGCHDAFETRRCARRVQSAGPRSPALPANRQNVGRPRVACRSAGYARSRET